MKARVFAAASAAFAVFSTFLSSLAGGPGLGAAVVGAVVGFAARAQHCNAWSSIARIGASSHRWALWWVGWSAREFWGEKSHTVVLRWRRWKR
jgi:hypothetical protein